MIIRIFIIVNVFLVRVSLSTVLPFLNARLQGFHGVLSRVSRHFFGKVSRSFFSKVFKEFCQGFQGVFLARFSRSFFGKFFKEFCQGFQGVFLARFLRLVDSL